MSIASCTTRDDVEIPPPDVFSVFRDDDEPVRENYPNGENTGDSAENKGEGKFPPPCAGEASEPVELFTFEDLREQYPRLNPPVVDGLFRSGEVVNVVSGSKIGKSWLAYNLALSIIDGRDWLDRFRCERGDVLLIDNELHRQTLAHRIPAVAEAMSLPASRYDRNLHVWPLRGRLRGLLEVAAELSKRPPGTFRAIILDAKYRFATAGQSENDNAAETLVYNTLDQIAERTGAAIVLVHHSSKGDQSGKRVTDVGSGAGAQSRAADCHLVLREHEEPDAVVLEAAVRSFPPVDPLPLRWAFPCWVPNPGLDPTALKGRKTAGEERQTRKDRDGCDAILKSLRSGPANRPRLMQETGFGKERLNRLVAMLRESGDITVDRTEAAANGIESDWFKVTD